jgi:hypothetical protein
MALVGGLTLVGEGVVYATGSQQLTDALLLLGLGLVTIAFAMLHGVQRGALGRTATILAAAVVIGGLCQVAAVASGLLLEADLGWLHGVGFLVMGLGLIGYGIVVLRSRRLGRAVGLIFVGLPIAPLLIGGLINAAVQVEVEIATIVAGALWMGVAVLSPQPQEVERT